VFDDSIRLVIIATCTCVQSNQFTSQIFQMSVYISCFDIDGDSCEEIEKELQKHHMNIIRHENTPGKIPALRW